MKNKEAAQLLEGWISKGRLHSQYSSYIQSQIVGNSDSFYSRTLETEGEEAAAAAFKQWSEEPRLCQFAASVLSVAKGLLALAQTEIGGEQFEVIEVSSESLFLHSDDIVGKSTMVVAFNPEGNFYGWDVPNGADDWGRNGRLGLIAVTLEAGCGRNGQKVAQLGLVLSPRGLSVDAIGSGGFNVVTINLEGKTSGRSSYPTGFRPNGFLRYQLGLSSLNSEFCIRGSYGEAVEAVVGFPGATKYLADALPNLGVYFSELAEKATNRA